MEKKRQVGSALAVAVALSACVPMAVSADAVETKGAFLQLLLQQASVKPDPSGRSPYVDVPARSTLWGYVHKAIELGLVKADTAKRFGAGDPLTAAQAAEMAAKLYHMDLGAVSPAAWARTQGLMSGAGPMTVSQAAAFVNGLRQLAKAVSPIPGSWVLSSTQRQEFLEALQNSRQAPFAQLTETESETVKLELVPALQNQPGIQSELDQLNQALNKNSFQMTLSAQQMRTGSHVYVVTQTTEHMGAKTSTAQEVDDDGVLYLQTNGSGWTNITQADGSLEQSLAQWQGMFTNVTWMGQNGGLDVFHAQLNPAAMARLVNALGEMGGSKASLQSVAQLFSHVPGQVVIDIDRSSGAPRIADLSVSYDISLSGPSLISMFGKDGANMIRSFDMLISEKAVYQYQPLVPTLPPGLHLSDWPTSAGVGGGTTGNTSGN
ncbi:S-layer homology domain-containing protein, partial [Alicyclobacillus sendaiensis]|uniref:S-layer homology domain-containing protein n=1 Tax=Alicyclobacillus sendaiensis TaxID=192387 RepID=UPI0026F457F3